MNEQETESAINFYLHFGKDDLKNLDETDVQIWYYGRACYAERCKALLKAALETSE